MGPSLLTLKDILPLRNLAGIRTYANLAIGFYSKTYN